ncbi:MAG: NAD(P)/FAD-dependent oxidoreductase [Clostridiales bacterium]|nr:NAD(P)/FAD-dependent oxidoreductase [Clostridiales bacterium]
MFDVAIIGGGVIGCATAYKLSKYNLNVCVLEKENDVAMGATRANSAIIHAGYDPEPDTIMARLNVDGVKQAKELAKILNVAYKNIGSMVLAFSEEERETVKKLYERGNKNGVPGLEILEKDEILKREPNVSENVVCALWAPSASVINPWEYALAFAEVAAVNGTKFIFDFEVKDIKKTDDYYKIISDGKEINAKYIVNAAGVYSDKIHNMVAKPTFNIIASKGQYYLMDKAEGSKANCTLFQCPSSVGKGVLVSPTVHGNLIVGPDATNSDVKDKVNTTGDQLEFVRLTAAKSVPDINYRNSIRNFAGMRANTDRDDFIIEVASEHFIDLAGIKSPGLSAAPAIADEAVMLLEKEGLYLTEKDNYTLNREHIVFKELSNEKKQAVIKENNLYGRVICRCETITEGEIVDAIHSPIPAKTVDGVKRRCNAGMGRCQGGFCGPKVLEIIARELNISPLEILKDKNGSNILANKTKGEK